jgi:hypothetical protein
MYPLGFVEIFVGVIGGFILIFIVAYLVMSSALAGVLGLRRRRRREHIANSE